MKAAPFEYQRAGSLDEVVETLSRGGSEARIVAGGQSLVPMMAMRLARPELLVDIAHVPELSGISEAGGAVEIAAATTQREAERSETVARLVPLLAAAFPHIGHIQTRNRGTVGGSIAHCDPTAEILLTAVALGAEVSLRSASGVRSVDITAFAEGPMQTVAEEDECLTQIRFPVRPDGLRVAAVVDEISARAGDFAIVGVAAEVGLDADGACRHLRLAASGASPVPVRAAPVEDALSGSQLTKDEVEEATRLLDPLLDPESDVQASAAYRRRVAPGLLARAIRTARDDALEMTP